MGLQHEREGGAPIVLDPLVSVHRLDLSGPRFSVYSLLRHDAPHFAQYPHLSSSLFFLANLVSPGSFSLQPWRIFTANLEFMMDTFQPTRPSQS